MRFTNGWLVGALVALSVGCKDVAEPPEPGATEPTVTAASTPSLATATTHKGWYTAPNGSSGTAGTAAAPWALSYALTGAGGKIHPGDTVWVRGGTYKLGTISSTVAGTATAPVIIRQYPRERATVDMSLNVMGGYVWFWGMEVKQGDLSWRDRQCFNDKAPGIKHINLIIHDCSGSGLGMWIESPNSEAYGNLLYNNGRAGAEAGRYAHGIYFQNASGTKVLKQNVVFNSFGHNFHGWAGDAPAAHRNYTIEENVSVNAGQFVDYGGREFLIGGGRPVENLVFRGNQAYRVDEPATTSIGYYEGADNPGGSTVSGNYLAGRMEVHHFAGLTVTGNTVVALPGQGDPAALVRDKRSGTWNWNSNQYWGPAGAKSFAVWQSSYTALDFPGWKSRSGFDGASRYQSGAPAGQKVTVYPNAYEKGRAVVTVWNWSGSASAKVDLSRALATGQAFEVRNAQRIWDPPVASGTYSGPVSLPLSSVAPYAAAGGAKRQAATTGTRLQVFLILPK